MKIGLGSQDLRAWDAGTATELEGFDMTPRSWSAGSEIVQKLIEVPDASGLEGFGPLYVAESDFVVGCFYALLEFLRVEGNYSDIK